MNNFKRGIFRIRSLDYAYRFFDKLELFKPFLLRDYNKRSFIRALWSVHNSKKFQFEYERLLHKLKIVGLRTTSTTENYLVQLEEAYNYKVKQEEKVRFTD